MTVGELKKELSVYDDSCLVELDIQIEDENAGTQGVVGYADRTIMLWCNTSGKICKEIRLAASTSTPYRRRIREESE